MASITHLHTLLPRIYHDEPPDLQTRLDINATLIVSWWCTLFALTTTLIRLFGRWVRTERLFREDWIMCYSLIPLMIRMGLVHVVLIWGTNNTTTDMLTSVQIHQREIGSRVVLACRIFYAAYIWVAKWTVLEFLKRLIGTSWAKSYEIGLRIIYGFLIVTFIAVIIGTLTECQPFDHYWQVVPDPGSHCREGLVQLVVMGVCDMVTDVVLIAFPIPLVMNSTMRLKKKLSLISLFLLSTVLIGITAYRIPSTIDRRSAQQYRSLLASLEILAACGVSNAIVIGSFVRDKGVKKAKFRAASIQDDGSSLGRQPTRTRTKSITHHHWGSDEDLVREFGVSLPPGLRHVDSINQEPRVAQAAPPDLEDGDDDVMSKVDPRWNFAEAARRSRRRSLDTVSSASTDIKLRDLKSALEDSRRPDTDLYVVPDTPSKMGFFDVGGLVDKPADSPSTLSRTASFHEPQRKLSVNQQAGQRSRAGSKAFLSDIGGLLGRHIREEDETTNTTGLRHLSQGRNSGRSPMRLGDRRTSDRDRSASQQAEARTKRQPSGPDDLDFGDVGGLLK